MKIKFLDSILVVAVLAIVASGFAHTWQQVNPNIHFGAFGMSADGRIICAVPSGTHPIVSTDSGKTWSILTNSPPTGSLAFVGGLAVSADGAKIYAALCSNSVSRTWVFVSPDQGTNWTPTVFPSTTLSTNLLVACSSDATKVVVATTEGPIYYSTNSGNSCYTSSVPNVAWKSIASSADGSRMVAAASFGSVYFSEDFGATWASTNLPGEFWNSVCISRDGQVVGAIASSIYISTNTGVTWSTNAISGRSIACSADGSTWIAAGQQIYTSTNGGVTWQTNLASAQWNAGVVSADGAEMVAFGSGQGTWLGRETPAPQLNIQSRNSALNVSWLIPSTNFVLQQNADLATTNWIAVPNSPTLNFTNLQQEVSVPVTASNAFFRLLAQ